MIAKVNNVTRRISLDDLKKGHTPTHPGTVLADIVRRHGLDLSYVSNHTKVSTDDLNGLFRGEVEIDRKMRKKLSVVFGSTASTLYKMQVKYNVAHLEYA